MAGWNKDAGFNFTLAQGDDSKRPYVDLARAIFGAQTEELLQHYPGGSPETDAASARALGGDLVIIHPTWAWIEAQKQSGRADIFRFRLDRAPLTPRAGSANVTVTTPAPSMRASSSMCSTIFTRFRGCTKTPIAGWRNWRRAIGSTLSGTAIPMAPTCRIGRPTAARAIR
jgi:hypothetical protein